MGTSFEYGKTLAGEGSLLLILGWVPYVGWLLGIIGVILLLRGVKELANYYQDNEIYENSRTGVIYYVIALVAAAIGIAGIVVGVGSATGFKFHSTFAFTPGFGVGLAVLFAGLIIAFIFNVIAAGHLRKTFSTLAQKSGEHNFETAGLLLYVGAWLTIIAVGLLLIFVAWILATIGFFSMKSKQMQSTAQPTYSYTPPPSTETTTPPPQAARFCQYCGAPVRPDAAFCPNCGRQLTP